MSWIELVAQRHPPRPPAGMQPPENAKDWFRIENSADDADSTDIYVYDSIGGWFGMWAEDFIEQVNKVTTSKINLRLNSPGGSVFDGIAIANTIRSHPATVTVYVDALAASIASVIAMAGDRLVMMPQSQIMVHNASGACYGDATEMTKMADLLDKQSLNIAQAYAQHTGGSLAEWQDYMAAETWFTAEEALAVGLADEVMPMRPKKGEESCEAVPAEASMHRTWDLSMYRYPGREQAPAPQTPFAKGGILPGQVLTAKMLGGVDLSGGIANEASQIKPEEIPGTTPGTITVDLSLLAEDDRFQDALRDLIRAEIINVFGSVAPSHSTAVEDGTWDAGAQEKKLPSPVPLATVKKMYTYWDEEQAEDGKVPKSACKLPHHFVSEDGTPGAASINGVRNALARLPQTEGLSDAERSAAEAHLRKHLAAFGGDSEDHLHDEQVQADDSPPAPTSAAKPVPPMPPDEEEEEDDDGEEPPPEEEDEPTDQADDWTSVVGLLVSPTSPSADDVFSQLKEGW